MTRITPVFYCTLFLTVTSSFGQTLNVENQDYYENLGFFGPKPTFERSLYKAKLSDGLCDTTDGQITLENCELYNFNIKITADESKYVVLPSPPFSEFNNCSTFLFIYLRDNVTVDDVFYDIITMEATIMDYSVAKTSIIIINSSNYDPYKLVYNVNGTEYVILNYFYFKLFLLLVVITGILILILEIREIMLKYKGKLYLELDNINHI